MQNSNSISFQKGLHELKLMFPNFDEEVISSILILNDMHFENAVDALLYMHGDSNKVNREEPEISIFGKKSSIVNYEDSVDDYKKKESSVKQLNLAKKENKNQKIKTKENNPEMTSVENVSQINKKNSFGQKFKSTGIINYILSY